jgi:4-aminobutyrate aminotransferase-like enzyme
MFGRILSMSCGHCHPKVTEALVQQVQALVQCSSVYPHEHAVRCAEMLAEAVVRELHAFGPASDTAVKG